jgi:hypothetical protein
MSTPVMTKPANPQASGAGKGAKQAAAAPPALRPFLSGTQNVEVHTYDETKTMTTATQTMKSFNVNTDGFLGDLWILVQCTTSANAATVAFAADAPWNSIQSIAFNDTTNKPIHGPYSGLDLKNWIKYGGFGFVDDPQQDVANYTAVSGAGATGGSFSFVLQIPLQFIAREALGALPNTSNQTVYSVDITLNSSANVYTTPPTTLGSVRVRIQQDGYRESAGVDIQGNPTQTTPPALGAVQYSRLFSDDISAGAQNFRLSPWEGLTRFMSFTLRDSGGARAGGETDFPDPLRFHYDNNVPYDRIKAIWQHKIIKYYGYLNAIDTAGGRDSGVYPLPFNRDWGLKPGQEGRYDYLAVSAGTTIRFDGSIGGSGVHKLQTLINYVNPPGGSVKALTAR